MTGLQSTGVAASAKHFPGHGDTAQDSHVSLPVVNRSLDELRRRELLPFAAAIEAGCRVIMTSHVLLPQLDRNQPGDNESSCPARSVARRAGLLRGGRQRRPGHGRCLRLAGDGGGGRRGITSWLRSALSRDREHRCSAGRHRAGSEQRGRRGHPCVRQGVGKQRAGCEGSAAISKPLGRRPGSLRIPCRAGPSARPSWCAPSMSNLGRRTGGPGHRADTPSYALRRIPISPSGYTVGAVRALALSREALSREGRFDSQRANLSPAIDAASLFNPTNPYSSLGATSTSIPLPERRLTGCVPNMLMCWSSTWVGHQTTAATPTWPRSARLF